MKKSDYNNIPKNKTIHIIDETTSKDKQKYNFTFNAPGSDFSKDISNKNTISNELDTVSFNKKIIGIHQKESTPNNNDLDYFNPNNFINGKYINNL
jgi:hypothetical protein